VVELGLVELGLCWSVLDGVELGLCWSVLDGVELGEVELGDVVDGCCVVELLEL
jgi:hypothetical protein